MTKALPPFTTPEAFLFETPPYDILSVTRDDAITLFTGNLKLDGYCPSCRQTRPFRRTYGLQPENWSRTYDNAETFLYTEYRINCQRHDHHVLRFHVMLHAGKIQKVGQYPSFASIALDESKSYGKLLSKEDAEEFHRAIGLAAHNVGIGSFVYLRRIFERLIMSRFSEFKEAEGWSDEDFRRLHMAERVAFLKDHLPPFLVKNARIYSILSLGLHELTEEQCLAFFPVLRRSTTLILEEDKKKRDELEAQRELEKAIAGFSLTMAKPIPAEEMTLTNLAKTLNGSESTGN